MTTSVKPAGGGAVLFAIVAGCFALGSMNHGASATAPVIVEGAAPAISAPNGSTVSPDAHGNITVTVNVTNGASAPGRVVIERIVERVSGASRHHHHRKH